MKFLLPALVMLLVIVSACNPISHLNLVGLASILLILLIFDVIFLLDFFFLDGEVCRPWLMIN